MCYKCEGTVQRSFCHYCNQLSWCNVLNTEVNGTLLGNFPIYFLVLLSLLPWLLALWTWWSFSGFLKSTCPSSSSSVPLSSIFQTILFKFIWTSLDKWLGCIALGPVLFYGFASSVPHSPQIYIFPKNIQRKIFCKILNMLVFYLLIRGNYICFIVNFHYVYNASPNYQFVQLIP